MSVEMSFYQRALETTERHEIMQEKRDTAWALGFLGWKGNIRSERSAYRIGLADSEKRTLVGTLLTDSFAISYREVSYSDGRTEPISTLLTIPHEELGKIGNLTAGQFNQTLLDRYQWVLNNDQLSYEFLSGALDSRSHIGTKTSWKNIIYFLPGSEQAEFFAGILTDLGYNPTITKPREQHNTHEVGVFKSEEVKRLAQHLQPRTPDKQKRIDILRDIETFSPADVIDVLKDREKLRRHLDKRPSWGDIFNARKERLTEYGKDVYARVFGEKSVAQASRTLAIFDLWEAAVKKEFGFHTLSDEMLKILIETAKKQESLPETERLPENLVSFFTQKCEEQLSQNEDCAHHWVINPPIDGVEHGECKKCSAQKSFTPWKTTNWNGQISVKKQ